MPELPEVETVRRGLEPWVRGRVIRDVRRVDAPAGPKYAGIERARGQAVREVMRRGKFLIMPLSGGDELVIHLGMTGVLSAVRPESHARVVMELEGEGPPCVWFRDPRRFGRWVCLAGGDRSSLPTLAALGVEPLDAAFTVAALARGLGATGQGVKAVLLGQRVVAGLGNIYVDEALFQAGIHPETAARAVNPAAVERLWAAIREVLGEALRDGGTTLRDYRTVSGVSGQHQARLAVYGRGGAACGRCGTLLVRGVVAQRGTTWCPRCQSRP